MALGVFPVRVGFDGMWIIEGRKKTEKGGEAEEAEKQTPLRPSTVHLAVLTLPPLHPPPHFGQSSSQQWHHFCRKKHVLSLVRPVNNGRQNYFDSSPP